MDNLIHLEFFLLHLEQLKMFLKLDCYSFHQLMVANLIMPFDHIGNWPWLGGGVVVVPAYYLSLFLSFYCCLLTSSRDGLLLLIPPPLLLDTASFGDIFLVFRLLLYKQEKAILRLLAAGYCWRILFSTVGQCLQYYWNCPPIACLLYPTFRLLAVSAR